MRRSVRNGLAIAAMAGGLWFLGNAVANASTQDASAANNVDQSSSSQGGGAANGNMSGASAENVNVTAVSTNVSGGSGGSNTANVNTGAITDGGVVYGASTNDPPKPPPAPSVTITTGDATVNQQANGGSVSGSGNVQITPSPVNQTASAVNNVQQTATSTSSDKHDGKKDGGPGPDSKSMMGPDGHGGFAGNFNFSFANAKNVNVTRVDSYVAGGDGGQNFADVNTGLIGYAPEIHKGTYNITTGSATVNQQANGGNVSNSGNVNIGPAGQGPCACTPAQQQEKKKKAAAPVAVVPAMNVSPAAAVLSSAQPTGVLATTGAEYGAPLALGLMALGAGAGLTVAGRRRKSASL